MRSLLVPHTVHACSIIETHYTVGAIKKYTFPFHKTGVQGVGVQGVFLNRQNNGRKKGDPFPFFNNRSVFGTAVPFRSVCIRSAWFRPFPVHVNTAVATDVFSHFIQPLTPCVRHTNRLSLPLARSSSRWLQDSNERLFVPTWRRIVSVHV